MKNSKSLYNFSQPVNQTPINQSPKKRFYTSYSKFTEVKLVTIGIASPLRILQWAEKTLPNGKIYGEVLNANTLHHKTFKPQKGGLFSEQIFGPLKDFSCACGKVDKSVKKSFVKDDNNLGEGKVTRKFCLECDVEYTWSVIRRYQLGYIKLMSPITHVWFLKGTPSYLSLLLDIKKRHLQSIIYCNETFTLEHGFSLANPLTSKIASLVLDSPNKIYSTWKQSLSVGKKEISNYSNNDLLGPNYNSFITRKLNNDNNRMNKIRMKRVAIMNKLNSPEGDKKTINDSSIQLNTFDNKQKKNKALYGNVFVGSSLVSRREGTKPNSLESQQALSFLCSLQLSLYYKGLEKNMKKFNQQREKLVLNTLLESELTEDLTEEFSLYYSRKKLNISVKNTKNKKGFIKNTHLLAQLYRKLPIDFYIFLSLFRSFYKKAVAFSILKSWQHIFQRSYLKSLYQITLNYPEYNLVSLNETEKTDNNNQQLISLYYKIHKLFVYKKTVREKLTPVVNLLKTYYKKKVLITLQKLKQPLNRVNNEKTVNEINTNQLNKNYLILNIQSSSKMKKNLSLTLATYFLMDTERLSNILYKSFIRPVFVLKYLSDISYQIKVSSLFHKKNEVVNNGLVTKNNSILNLLNSSFNKSVEEKELSSSMFLKSSKDLLKLLSKDKKLRQNSLYPFTENKAAAGANLAEHDTEIGMNQKKENSNRKEGRRLYNNVYMVSHRERWNSQDQLNDNGDKDWQLFSLYSSGGVLPGQDSSDYIDSPIFFYKKRLSYGPNLGFPVLAGSDGGKNLLASSSLTKTPSLYNQTNFNLSNAFFSGSGIVQHLLNELTLTEIIKLDKQNRILLYQMKKIIVKKRDLLNKQKTLLLSDKQFKKEIRELCKKRDLLIRRTKLVRKLYRKNSDPASMILTILPVLPPDLRPIVKMGNQIAASDLNRLYQRVIYRNDRLKKFLKDPATSHSYSMKYAQRLLQEAVDNLISNGKSGVTVEKDARGRALKSLSDVLKGKQGRFRQFLLGKRVDYSGRSVIVVGPKLKLSECGIPIEMALELYLPFLLKAVLNKNLKKTVVGAKTLIQTNRPLALELLREIMQVTPVLLNRAPTLHRLGFQAFVPRLVEGRAILLHPLVCSAFNADFDGDQMAVHVPITIEARAEAWKLMLSVNNLLSPATGDPLAIPSQDMVLGCYYLTTKPTKKYTNNDLTEVTTSIKKSTPNLLFFNTLNSVLFLYDQKLLRLHEKVWVKWSGFIENGADQEEPVEIRLSTTGKWQEITNNYIRYYDYNTRLLTQYFATTPGRILFNSYLTP